MFDKEINNLMQNIGKISQTHVSFPQDAVMIKKDDLLHAEQKDKKMYLTMRGGKEIILHNTNFNQFQEAWDK
jgi:hypothetical protein